MRDAYYRVQLSDGALTGLTTIDSAQTIAELKNGVVLVDDSEFFHLKSREYRGPRMTVSEAMR
jgi:hypothetical protein